MHPAGQSILNFLLASDIDQNRVSFPESGAKGDHHEDPPSRLNQLGRPG